MKKWFSEQLQAENASLRQELETLRPDHATLVEATQKLMADCEQLQRREAQLEAINDRLVDMLWGRRTERREYSADQLLLGFLEEPPRTEQEQAVIMAQEQAEEARDEELVRAAVARRHCRTEAGTVPDDDPSGAVPGKTARCLSGSSGFSLALLIHTETRRDHRRSS